MTHLAVDKNRTNEEPRIKGYQFGRKLAILWEMWDLRPLHAANTLIAKKAVPASLAGTAFLGLRACA